MEKVNCDCLLCQPTLTGRAHPKYGYDMNAVKDVECLMCSEPIGEEPYNEFPMLARFGNMMFVHERCDDEKSRVNGK